MKQVIILALILAVFGVFASCGGSSDSPDAALPNDTPTEAYKRLYNAVKAKDMPAIKAAMTQKTIDFGVVAAKQNNKPGDTIYENGFTATTFAETLPTIRDERVSDTMGSIEVWNASEKKWEDLPFVIENGRWRLAIGELWAGTFKSPGKGRDIKEREAANLMGGAPTPMAPNVNANTVTVDNVPANVASNTAK
jgi:hypothetical protein